MLQVIVQYVRYYSMKKISIRNQFIKTAFFLAIPGVGSFAYTALAATTLTVPTAAVAVNASFPVSWNVSGGGDLSGDWVGIFKPGAADDGYEIWTYTGATAQGSVSFTISSAGTYEARYFKNGGYEKTATSQPFTVGTTGGGGGGGSTMYTLVVSPASLVVGNAVSVSWQAPSGNDLGGDWVGIFKVADNDQNYIAWTYTDGRAQGSASFLLSEAGTYQARYFKNGYSRQAVSSNITVTTAGGGGGGGGTTTSTFSLVATPSVATPGGTISVRYTVPTGRETSRDWIGMYRFNESDIAYMTYVYAPGNAQGTVSFTAPSENGTYQFRYFLDNGYSRVAVSNNVTIGGAVGNPTSSTQYILTVPGATTAVNTFFSVSWSTPANVDHSGDWIGIFPQGAADDAEVARTDTNGAVQGMTQFSLGIAGVYTARYFDGDDVRKAESRTFTIGTSGGGGNGNYVLTAHPKILVAGESATVRWTTPSGVSRTNHWVGLYRTGAADSQFVTRKYIRLRGEETTFSISSAGTYEFRYFTTTNATTKVATSDSITVLPKVISAQSITNVPSSGANVIAFGDSLIQGPGVPANSTFPAQLSRRLGVPILNKGLSGDTTATALARLDRDVLSQNPKVVVVLVGGNDILQRIFQNLESSTGGDSTQAAAALSQEGADLSQAPLTEAETRANLNMIVDRIQARGAAVVLLGLTGGIFGDNHEQLIREIVVAKHTGYVPNIMKGIIGNPLLTIDYIHPNTRGYSTMASRADAMMRVVLQR